MEILNSGSFIPLDNRERIEQLIFTAQTLAIEVSRNEGFEKSGQTNQQIGLELWNGAEYMTRSHEEVTIRNIFLSKFLERLREIERDQGRQAPTAVGASNRPLKEVSVTPVQVASPRTQLEPESQSESASDEFLGVIDDTPDSRSYADECVPECEEEIVSILNSKDARTVTEKVSEAMPGHDSTDKIGHPSEAVESVAPTPTRNASGLGIIESAPEAQEEHSSSGEPETTEAETEISDKHPVNSVVISEQEPFNFDACTITAVIQLLPEVNSRRDCVVSVRSHDFAPQIVFTATNCESRFTDLLAHLSSALEQYRTSLPVLAAEKMKKEKSQTKKRVSKPAEKTVKGEKGGPDPSVAPEQAKDQQALFAS